MGVVLASSFWENSGALVVNFPVAFMAYYPSLTILRSDNVPVLTWLSPFLGIAAFYGSYKLWMKGASKYDGSVS